MRKDRGSGVSELRSTTYRIIVSDLCPRPSVTSLSYPLSERVCFPLFPITHLRYSIMPAREDSFRNTVCAVTMSHVFLQCLPVGAEMVEGALVLRPLSAVILIMYSIPGVRPLRVRDSELPGTTSSALWPSADV